MTETTIRQAFEQAISEIENATISREELDLEIYSTVGHFDLFADDEIPAQARNIRKRIRFAIRRDGTVETPNRRVTLRALELIAKSAEDRTKQRFASFDRNGNPIKVSVPTD